MLAKVLSSHFLTTDAIMNYKRRAESCSGETIFLSLKIFRNHTIFFILYISFSKTRFQPMRKIFFAQLKTCGYCWVLQYHVFWPRLCPAQCMLCNQVVPYILKVKGCFYKIYIYGGRREHLLHIISFELTCSIHSIVLLLFKNSDTFTYI